MFWERLVEECNRIGKKPNAVAKELGISSGSVTAWKQGGAPSAATMKRLCEYFQVPVEYMTGYSEDRELQRNDVPDKSPSDSYVIDKELLMYRIVQLCDEKNVRPTAAFIESGVGKNFKTNLKFANPSKRNLMLLAHYFGVSVEYLLGVSLDRMPTDSHSDTKPAETGNKLSGVEFALYGELSGLSEDQQLDILDYVRFKKHQWENRS